LSSGAFLDLAARIVEIGREAGAIVIVNDRADVARLSKADGVHVGQEDLPPAGARAVVGPDADVGVSTHTEAQIDAALDQPISYLAVGPIFGTSTKATGYDAVGLDRVRYAAGKARLAEARRAKAGTIPVVAIGGITLDTIADVIQAGATSAAVITDLVATGDPEARVRAYVDRLRQTGKV
jgi:thiamine-phosphate diphosphorylase